MIRAVCYFYDDREWDSRFSQPHARIAVRNREGNVVLKPWGRRPMESGRLPIGSSARYAHIDTGKWDEYLPINVKIMATAFCVANVAGQAHWFPVTKGHYLHGICARWDAELRIYLVTQESPPDMGEYESWPRMQSAPWF